MFSPPMGGVCGAYAIRPYTCYMPYIKIRIRFSNGVYIPVGDTAMFSPPMGGVCGAHAIRPYTRYMPYIEIRMCFSNGEYVSVRNTDMFSEPGTRYPSKYERVSRTGCTLRIEIRKRFPKGIYVTHRNTNVFSELGEGVDEPEDGEENDGGAYDAVQYADTANVEPSAEARHEVGDQQPSQDGSGGNTGQTNGHVPDAGRKDEGEPGKEADI